MHDASGDPPRREAGDPRQGLPDHHDPTAGIGGAPAARSALTLRLVLAAIGLLAGTVGAVLAARGSAPTPLVLVLAAVACVAAVNVLVVARRKARGEPG